MFSERGFESREPGACDICKKRKSIVGDSGRRPGNHCSSCTVAGLDCTHAHLLKVRTKQ
ncbi:hypothetical protein K438DRAFT_1649151 [Mycena galopus ATCC 62051]|nr:hypothetical protein K438DRAFT_1649151 [Mycena galopus ATCC 62051]